MHRVIAFYLDHRADVDAYLAEYRCDLQQQTASAPRRDVADLRDRLEALVLVAHAGNPSDDADVVTFLP